MDNNSTYLGEFQDLKLVKFVQDISAYDVSPQGTLILKNIPNQSDSLRNTTHFSLNTLVSHQGDAEHIHDSKYAVVADLLLTTKLNMIHGLSSTDTFFWNENNQMELDSPILFIPKGDANHDKFSAFNIISYDAKEDAAENYQALSKAIEQYFLQEKIPFNQMNEANAQVVVTEAQQAQISFALGVNGVLPRSFDSSLDFRFKQIEDHILNLDQNLGRIQDDSNLALYDEFEKIKNVFEETIEEARESIPHAADYYEKNISAKFDLTYRKLQEKINMMNENVNQAQAQDPSDKQSPPLDDQLNPQSTFFDNEGVYNMGQTDDAQNVVEVQGRLDHLDLGDNMDLDGAVFGGLNPNPPHFVDEPNFSVDFNDQDVGFSSPPPENDFDGYEQDDFSYSESLTQDVSFDMSIQLDALKDLPVDKINEYFSTLSKQDAATQLATLKRSGLDFNNPQSIALLSDLNFNQYNLANNLGNLAINSMNDEVGRSSFFPQVDSSVYLDKDHSDFHLSNEEDPYQAIKLGSIPVFDFDKGLVVDQDYFCLSLDEQESENANAFLNTRRSQVESLIQDSIIERDQKKVLFENISQKNNTYFPQESSNSLDSLQDLKLLIEDFCRSNSVDPSDTDVQINRISIALNQPSDDMMTVSSSIHNIYYLEFNEQILNKSIIQLLEQNNQAALMDAVSEFKSHYQTVEIEDVKSNSLDQDNSNQTTQDPLDDGPIKEDDPKSKSSNSNLRLDFSNSVINDQVNKKPGDAHLAALNSTQKARSDAEIDAEIKSKRPLYSNNNYNRYNRTAADEIAALGAKTLALMIELIKKTILLLIAALKTLFSLRNEEKYIQNKDVLAQVWQKPLSENIRNNGLVADGLADSEKQKESKQDAYQLTYENLNKNLLLDPFTAKRNQQRSGVSLKNFDEHIGTMYEFNGKKHLCIDILNHKNIEGYSPTPNDHSPVLVLIAEDQLPKNPSNDKEYLINTFLLEQLADELIYTSVNDIQEAVGENRASKIDGQFIDYICPQYLEQSRISLGSKFPFNFNEPTIPYGSGSQWYKDKFMDAVLLSGIKLTHGAASLKDLHEKFDFSEKIKRIREKIKPKTSNTQDNPYDQYVGSILKTKDDSYVCVGVDISSQEKAVIKAVKITDHETPIDIEHLEKYGIVDLSPNDVVFLSDFSSFKDGQSFSKENLEKNLYHVFKNIRSSNYSLSNVKHLLVLNNQDQQVYSDLLLDAADNGISFENTELKDIFENFIQQTKDPLNSELPHLKNMQHIHARFTEVFKDFSVINRDLNQSQDYQKLLKEHGFLFGINGSEFNVLHSNVYDQFSDSDFQEKLLSQRKIVDQLAELAVANIEAKSITIEDLFLDSIEDINLSNLSQHDLSQLAIFTDKLNGELKGLIYDAKQMSSLVTYVGGSNDQLDLIVDDLNNHVAEVSRIQMELQADKSQDQSLNY